MKNKFKTTSKFLVILSASAFLTACSSLGGFSDILGIDAKDATTNDPLVKSVNGDLPTPQGAATQVAAVSVSQASNKVGLGKIVPPKVTTSGIKTPIYVPKPKYVPKKVAKVVVKPKPVARPKPKPVVKPVIVAKAATKISPSAYKYVDLFRFRGDMKAGKLQNPLATASAIANNKANKCKLEARKFTCFVTSLDREAYIMVTP